MKTKYNRTVLMSFLFMLVSIKGLSQNEEFINTTPIATFIQEANSKTRETEYIYLSIKNHNNQGLILLSKDNEVYEDIQIGGTLYLILENNEMIKCIDRKQYSKLNNRTSASYKLTENEIIKLKKHGIQKVIYSLWRRGIGSNPHQSRYSAIGKNQHTDSYFWLFFR